MIALLIVNLCLLLWFLARIGSERRHRIALEQALIGGFADAREREGHMSDRVDAAHDFAGQSWNVACAAMHRVEGLEAKAKG